LYAMSKNFNNLPMINIKDRNLRKLFIWIIVLALIVMALGNYVIYPLFSKLLIKSAEEEATVASQHISHMFFPEERDTALITPETVALVDRVRSDFKFTKLKIFSTSGETLFSTDIKEIGEINENDYFNEVVALGSIYTKIVKKDSKSLEGKKVTRDVVETYIPVMQGGSFVGAFELYYDISEKYRMLHDALFISNSLIISSAILFLVIIFIILVRLDKTVTDRKKAYRELEAANINLTTTKEVIEQNHNELQEAFSHISNLIHEVSSTGNITLRYENPKLLKCYENKQCDKLECPCYGLEAIRCWQVAGTFCGGEVQGSSAKKYRNCHNCDVYQKAVPDPSSFIGESFNNMMHILNLKHQELERTYKKLKSTQSQLLQHEKMAAMGTLSGGIAHEFNNILAALLGYAELTKYDVPDGSQASANLEEVLKAGNRAKDLVKQILTFSRQNDEKLSPIQINYVIKEVIKLLQVTTPSSIEVRQNISTDCKNVMANSTIIHQLLINLYTNAVQSMEGKGLLEISTHQITHTDHDNNTKLYTLVPGEYIRLTISDNGPGIDPTIKDRIFDPFFTTKEVGKGTGMGLSVVHGIIEKCGGLITVESEPGQGTSFHVYFPAINEEPGQQEESQKPISKGNECILFVDDEMMLAYMGKQILERLGYKVSVRTSSVEALEAFRAQPDKFDLIITDQTMPNISGDELAKSLLEIRPDIPIILCTGYSSSISEDRAREIGIRAFIMKPVDERVMASTIRLLLDVD
jgi:signal transduction histidine kinase/CheY-like chemotaxis protein